MAKLRGSKEQSLVSIRNRLEEALADKHHLIAYIKAIINSINKEIEETGSKNKL